MGRPKGGPNVAYLAAFNTQAHFPELRPSFYGDPAAAGKLPLDYPDHKAVVDPLHFDTVFEAHEAARAAALRAAGVADGGAPPAKRSKT